MDIMSTCFFNSCNNPTAPDSWKCIFHKSRDKCIIPDCRNQACGRRRCVSHGGKNPCSVPACDSNARIGGVCGRHGKSKKKRSCGVEGCTRFAHARQRCVAHGGGRQCDMEGCKSQSRNGGLCQRHGRIQAEEQALALVKQDIVKVENFESLIYEEDPLNYWIEAEYSPPATIDYTSSSIWLDEDVKMLEILLAP